MPTTLNLRVKASRARCVLLATVLSIPFSHELAATENGDQESELHKPNLTDNHGIGLGFTKGASNFGSVWFYDYNLVDQDLQVHFNLSNLVYNRENKNKVPIIEASRRSTGVGLRYVFSSGFYAGLGLEYSSFVFKYNNQAAYGADHYLNHKTSSTDLFLDLGIQGNSGFYMQLGLRPTTTISQPKSPNFDRIDNEDGWQGALANSWTRQKEKSYVYIGFGYYIQSLAEAD